MRYRIPIQYLLIITHLSVFIFTALFTGFSTYFIINRPKISEKVSAQKQEEYIIYERREVLALRPNGHHKVRITGFARNLKSDEEYIIYSFVDDPYQRKFQRTVPTATLLSNGNIFLNGVSDFGFAVLDISGNNLTADYRTALSKRDFLLSHSLFAQDNEIVYTYRGDKARRKIYWKKGDQSIHTIDSTTFPNVDFWLKPLGWSGVAPFDFYVSRETTAAEGASAKLWRVSLKEKKVRELASVSGTMQTDVYVCSEQDYAVFISGVMDPAQGAFGATVAPSRIMISNLVEDALAASSATEIASSQDLFTNLFISCESRKILVKEGETFRLFSIDGKELPRPIFKGKPLFLSGTGEMVITKYDSKFLIENLTDGIQREIGEEMGYTIIGLSSH